jgi:TonB-dependent receptor
MKKQLFVLFLLVTGFAWGQQGSIKGLILDESGFAMPGALVTIEALQMSTLSNEVGEFTMVAVPAGNQVLTIRFMGYNNATVEVVVEAGKVAATRSVLAPTSSTLSEVEVTGFLQNQAKALNKQRKNTAVTNIVSADQIGRFPDASVGEAVKRIPGITMQNDQGEARDIVIRGLAPQLNSVMINGERMPSAEGDNRRIQMDLIPSDMIQTIEVNKALTPDMDADAIGGAVNLVTRQAPNQLRVSATGATGYNFLVGQPIWTGAAIVADRFADKKLGVVFSASVHDHNLGSDNAEFEWDIDENGSTVTNYEVRGYNLRRLRQSYSLGLDYRIANGHKIFFNGIYNNRKDWENRYRLRITDIETDSLGVTTGQIRHQTKGGTPDEKNARLENQTAYNFALGGEHLFGILKTNWSVNTALAQELRPHERYISFRERDVVINNLNPGNTRTPYFATAADADLSNYSLHELTEENGNTSDQDVNARLDFELPIIQGKNQSFLKFGGRTRNKLKERNNDFFEYDFINNEPSMGDLANGNLYDFDRADNFQPGDYFNSPTFNQFASAEYLGGLDLNNSALFDRTSVPEEFAPINFTARENILAGYLMYTQNIGTKHQIIGGLRLENTRNQYEGNEYDLVSGTITPTGVVESNYSNFLPSILYRLNATANTVIRASYTSSLARPNYYDLVPYVSINSDDNEIALGNSDLLASTASNFDLGGEYYFQNLGLIGVAGFYKNIDNFIYTNVYDGTFNGDDYEFSQPQNGGTAQVYGVELSFQRQLDFLPSILKNLNFFGNYTWLTSDAEGIIGRESEQVQLAGAAPHMLNLSLAYEDKRTLVRVSYNLAGQYIDEYGDSKFEDRYYDGQQFLDVNVNYLITPRFRVFVELNNLLNQPLRYFQYQEQFTMQMEYYRMRANLGLKFDL